MHSVLYIAVDKQWNIDKESLHEHLIATSNKTVERYGSKWIISNRTTTEPSYSALHLLSTILPIRLSN